MKKPRIDAQTARQIVRDHLSKAGTIGGARTSPAKVRAARKNGKKGGRPKGCRPEQHDAMRRYGWLTCTVCKKPLWEVAGDVMRPINGKKGGRQKKSLTCGELIAKLKADKAHDADLVILDCNHVPTKRQLRKCAVLIG